MGGANVQTTIILTTLHFCFDNRSIVALIYTQPDLYARWAFYTRFTHILSAVHMQSMCGGTQAVQKHWQHHKKFNLRKVILSNVKNPGQRIFSRSQLNFLVGTEQKVLDTQLFVHNFSNWVIESFYFEQYCTSSQHTLQLGNILLYLSLKYYHCFSLCCGCHYQLAIMWIRVNIFTDLKMVLTMVENRVLRYCIYPSHCNEYICLLA